MIDLLSLLLSNSIRFYLLCALIITVRVCACVFVSLIVFVLLLMSVFSLLLLIDELL